MPKNTPSLPLSILTLGPLLFHWPADQKRDFYFRMADEAPVDTVYIGEVVCSKRAPFFEPYYEDVAQRLERAGKKVVFSTLAEIMLPRERKMVEGTCALASDATEIEANDAAALYHLRGKPHRIGSLFNVYNEETLTVVAAKGATHITLPPELPSPALRVMAQKAAELKVGLEVQVYGRVGLALSARCYHARSHEKVKNNCLYVCEKDPDGMTLETLDGTPFLTVNGIQTLSYTCLNLMPELTEMEAMGISAFRLSPHTQDMVAVATLFRAVLDGKMSAQEGVQKLKEAGLKAPFCNGFYYGAEGHRWVEAAQ